MIGLKKKTCLAKYWSCLKTIREELSSFIADFSLQALREQGVCPNGFLHMKHF